MAKPDKPFNGGTWTLARMRAFAMSALRRASWPQKYKAIDRAFVGTGINPATGKTCKLHRCEECHGLFPKTKMHADHREPVVPIEPNWGENQWLGYDWNQILQRLWTDADTFNVYCHDCHKAKTDEERQQRDAIRSNQRSLGL